MPPSPLVRALALSLLAFAVVPACGSVSPGTDGGGAGTTGAAGTTGTAGSHGGAGTTGAGGTTGSAGTMGAGGTTGAAGSHGGAGTTGSAGHDGGVDAGASCADLQAAYAAALPAAKACTVGATNQCGMLASGELSPCFYGCQVYVQDATKLNQIKASWTAAGCANGTFACPAIACIQPRGGSCVAGDGGGGVCVAQQLTPN